MKKSMIIIASLLVFATAGFSQIVTAKKIERAIQGYYMALKSDNNGLKNDAIFQLSRLKSTFPDLDLSQAVKELRKAIKTEKNPLVRMHADLAIIYLNDNSLAKILKIEQDEDSMTFFTRLHTKINASALALDL